MWAGAGAVAVLVGAILFTVPGLLGKMLGSMVTATEKGMRSHLAESTGTVKESRGLSTAAEALRREPFGDSVHYHDPSVVVEGYVVKNGMLNVVLSDGRILTELDDEIARLDRHKLTLKDGTSIYFKRSIRHDRPATEGRNKETTARDP